MAQATQLQEKVKALFNDGKIDVFIGHGEGSLPLRTRPVFIRKAEEADKLIWNALCSHNLAAYLGQFFVRKPVRRGEEQKFPKVGIAVRGCDLRSISLLARENQILRDHVVAIGIPCSGIADIKAITEKLGTETAAGYEAGSEGSITVKTVSGNSKDFALEDILENSCRECRSPQVDTADEVLEGKGREGSSSPYKYIAEFLAKSDKDRWAYFTEEISKCIRCNACRQACPSCYCKECFADKTRPRWVSTSSSLSDVMFYHIGRMMHMAGRCVECDACVRACPMGIDLRTFTNLIVKDVESLFDYTPGVELDEIPPLLTFLEDENQDYITEPNKQE